MKPKTANRPASRVKGQRGSAPGASKGAPKIRFRATLQRPAASGGAPGNVGAEAASSRGGWLFLTLPKVASAKLPSRSMVSVQGVINGAPFQATLEPDGKGGHWLKVDKKLRAAAGAPAPAPGLSAGDVVTLEIVPVAPGQEPEPTVPPDLRKALAANFPGAAKAREVWSNITPVARRDWIFWMTSGKKAETRALRIGKACDMLAKGKRRPCCFDRSGMYGKSLSCPVGEDEVGKTGR